MGPSSHNNQGCLPTVSLKDFKVDQCKRYHRVAEAHDEFYLHNALTRLQEGKWEDNYLKCWRPSKGKCTGATELLGGRRPKRGFTCLGDVVQQWRGVFIDLGFILFMAYLCQLQFHRHREN